MARFQSLPLVYFVFLVSLLAQALSLTCYECQERKAGDWCSQPKKRECNSATSICLKYLHKEGRAGFPNHIMAKCELRSFYTQNKINACELAVKNRNGSLTVSETCTCDTDLCNNAELGASRMISNPGAGGSTGATGGTTAPRHQQTPAHRIQPVTIPPEEPVEHEEVTPAESEPVPAPEPEPESEEGSHQREEPPQNQPSEDEAVESPSPRVKDAKADGSSEERTEFNSAPPGRVIQSIYNAILIIGLQLVFLSSLTCFGF